MSRLGGDRSRAPNDVSVVALVNSLGSTSEIWDPVADALATEFRVVRSELPGHGGAPAPSGRYTMSDLAGDIRSTLDRVGIERANVVGVSIGGMIALQLAIESPDRVQRLVLCATSGRLGPRGAWAERAELVLRDGMEAVAAAVAARWITPEFAGTHPGRAARFRAMVADTDPIGYAGCCWAIEDMDLLDGLSFIDTPTLVLHGDRDPAIPIDHGETLARLIPRARLEVIRGGAHLPMLEYPEAVGSSIVQHLTNREATHV